jgi:hypothetical protein
LAIDNPAAVKDILSFPDHIDAFHLPLSSQVFDEFHEFRQMILQAQVAYNGDGSDK